MKAATSTAALTQRLVVRGIAGARVVLSRMLECCQNEPQGTIYRVFTVLSARDPGQATRLRPYRVSCWQPRVDVAPEAP
jgi:hypothetical protein